MPTYDYRCDECGHRFEEMQKITEPAITKCPSCGKEAVKRLISATAFHLKGGGWYKTDYASGSSAGGSSSSSADSSSGGGSSESSKSTPNTESTSSSSSEKKSEAVPSTPAPAKPSGSDSKT